MIRKNEWREDMRSLFFDKQPQTSLTWLALLRSMVGLVILTSWYSNMGKGFYTADGLLEFFTHVFPQTENPLLWYAAFINNVILPVRSVFAPFQLVAEFLLGLALFLGGFTRLFSLAGIFFLVNTMLATFGHDWLWSYLMPIGILVVVFITRAGRALGIDQLLLKRFGERGFLLW
jgi:uncharacterized membrane protein YphA (DoxX/SURF4 family)